LAKGRGWKRKERRGGGFRQKMQEKSISRKKNQKKKKKEKRKRERTEPCRKWEARGAFPQNDIATTKGKVNPK